MTHQVLYDDACNVCKVIADLFMDWDRDRRRIRALPTQGAEGAALLHAVPEAERLESFHLVRPDGSVASAGPALPELLRLLPGGRPLAAPMEKLPGVTAATYWWIARHRMTLSRPVPSRLKRRATSRLAARLAREG